ncbi:MAG TPA: hypothetical protein VHY09_13090 [Candidatus Methylacidiphilales bacterium]|jgi:6-phospho-beta-glucosidase|nr:hypothetical protein [Candidatus Methylacidiphilales bacterium]
MKTVFFGGGSHRLVSILRGTLKDPAVFGDGEIFLYDPNVQRAEAVGRTVKQTPEFRKSEAKIRWGSSLDEALPGASAVTVTLAAGTAFNREWSDQVCWDHGFMGSDNVSPSGSIFGVMGAPILLELARKMEQHCPDAWILDFANPVAMLAGMVTRHTKIKALGICGGFMNHFADIGRIFGKDESRKDLDVHCAGINHLSFIVDGTLAGRDLFEQLDRHLAGGWKMCALDPMWNEGAQKSITRSVTNLVRFYRELGVLIFSTEGDGMAHLAYEEFFERDRTRTSRAEVEKRVEESGKNRAKANADFEAKAAGTLDDAFWAAQGPRGPYVRTEDDIFIRCLRGIAGVEKIKLAASSLNRGAIEGIGDDQVVEYTQYLYKQTSRPAGRYKVPGIVHGLISSLANHQTLVGDACFAEDPKLLAEALLSYPMRPFSKDAKALFRELIEINKAQIPQALHRAVDYLR